MTAQTVYKSKRRY